MKRRRELSAEERKLWNHVARSVTPIDPEKLGEPQPEAAKSPSMPRQTLPKRKPAKPKKPAVSPPRTPSPLTGGDPRRERLVARGRLPIDGVLDLHGMRQTEADRATSAFIARSLAKGHRILLIITGKGSKEGHQGRGVLRKQFMDGVEFGLYGPRIASVKPAHQRHGGSGAFYVFLKPRKK